MFIYYTTRLLAAFPLQSVLPRYYKVNSAQWKSLFFLGLPFPAQPSLSSRAEQIKCNFLPQFPVNSLSERCVYRLLLKLRFSIWSSANSTKQTFLLLPFTKKKELPLWSANKSTCRKIHCCCIFSIFMLKRNKQKSSIVHTYITAQQYSGVADRGRMFPPS